VIFILFAMYLVGNTIVESPRDAAVGTGLLLLGLPFYWYFLRQYRPVAPDGPTLT
jgi:hypothetical protein